MTVTSSRTIQWIVIILILTAIAGGVYHYFNVRAAKLTAPADTVVFITTPGASSWIVPVGVTSVKVEAIGGGGGGSYNRGGGGGGGAYSMSSGISVTPGSIINVSVGAGGGQSIAGGDTTFNTSTVVAKGGAQGTTNSDVYITAAGGAAASGTGTIKYSGGDGGAGDKGNGQGAGGGGGGAAGPLGAGGAGGTAPTASTGSGGGGSGGGTAGATVTTGGNNDAGAGGGSSSGASGSSSAVHSAGGGGGGYFGPITGGAGGSGKEWDSSHGSGAGGGGGGGVGAGGGSNGGNAGNYGGGGGGGGYTMNGGAGAPGLIIVTYKATTATMNTSPTTLNTNGLVGYWAFDGKDTVWTSSTAATTLDKSGSGNTGTLTNMSRAASPTEGKLGQALTFNGSNSSYISVGTGLAFSKTTPFSGSAWINTTNGINRTIVSNYTYATSPGWVFELGVATSANKPYFLIINANAMNGRVVYGSTNLNDGRWHHVAFTYSGANDASGILLYVDGSAETLTTLINTDPGTLVDTGIKIGQFAPNLNFFDGKMDDVRIYNRALSAGEVAGLYTMGTATVNASTNALNTNGLVGQWSFDGKQTVWTSSSAATTLDTSGNNYTGTLTNMSRATSPTEGKIGQAIDFGGTNQYVSVGAGYNGVKSVSFWIKPDSTTKKIIDLNGTANIEVVAQTIAANGFTSPTIYVDGAVSSIIDTNWHFVTITTGTSINASAVDIGRVSSGYFDKKLDDVRFYSSALSTTEVASLYNAGGPVAAAIPPSWSCGSGLAVTHTAGTVAPGTKSVTYGTVTSSLSGASKCWITQNLGADQHAGSATDSTEPSAGWYWQFNRMQGYKHDGTPRTPSTAWIISINESSDWTSANDPCTIELGAGWRLPTSTERTNADANGAWNNYTGTYNSVLKLHAAGDLDANSGALFNIGTVGVLWGSTQFVNFNGIGLYLGSSLSAMIDFSKAYGFSVRCLKD